MCSKNLLVDPNGQTFKFFIELTRRKPTHVMTKAKGEALAILVNAKNDHIQFTRSPHSKPFFQALMLLPFNSVHLHELNLTYLSPKAALPKQDRILMVEDFVDAKTQDYFRSSTLRLLLLDFACCYLSSSKADVLMGEYSELLDRLRHVKMINTPLEALLLNNRGLQHRTLRRYDLSSADYSRAIQICPEYSLAYNNRGFANEMESNLDAAFADYCQAIVHCPTFALPYANRADILYMREQYDESMADLKKCLELDPSCINAYETRYKLYDTLQWLVASCSDLSILTTLKPVYARDYRMLLKEIHVHAEDPLF